MYRPLSAKRWFDARTPTCETKKRVLCTLVVPLSLAPCMFFSSCNCGKVVHLRTVQGVQIAMVGLIIYSVTNCTQMYHTRVYALRPLRSWEFIRGDQQRDLVFQSHRYASTARGFSWLRLMQTDSLPLPCRYAHMETDATSCCCFITSIFPLWLFESC